MRKHIIGLLLFGGIAVTSAPAHAKPPIRIERLDRMPVISVFAGETANRYAEIRARTLRKVTGFDFLASDLTRAGGDEKIRRSNVRLVPRRPRFRRGRSTLLRIHVLNVPAPGTYTGRVAFSFANNERIELPLRLVVKPFTLRASAETVRVRLAHCPDFKLCELFKPFMPARVFRDERHMTLRANPSAPVVVNDVDALLSDDDGDSLTKDVVNASFDKPKRYARARTISVPIQIDREAIEPGDYAGQLLVHVQGLNEPVEVAVDLDVRREPLLPLLLIALGVMLGRLIRKLHQPPEGGDAGREPAARGEPIERPPKPHNAKERFQATLRWLTERVSGIRRDFAGTRGIWLWQAILAVLLVVGLTAVGFHTLYAKDSTTFGAGGLGDYITLVAWGLSADVASRTIATIGRAP
jgi:hypothetical protein